MDNRMKNINTSPMTANNSILKLENQNMDNSAKRKSMNQIKSPSPNYNLRLSG